MSEPVEMNNGASPKSPSLLSRLREWVDSFAPSERAWAATPHSTDPSRWAPHVSLHAGSFGVLPVKTMPIARAVAGTLHFACIFGITASYYRYFSRRTFRTSRFAQFEFAVIGNSATQRGPLWWASQHRHHRAIAQRPDDTHSLHEHGFFLRGEIDILDSGLKRISACGLNCNLRQMPHAVLQADKAASSAATDS